MFTECDTVACAHFGEGEWDVRVRVLRLEVEAQAPPHQRAVGTEPLRIEWTPRAGRDRSA